MDLVFILVLVALCSWLLGVYYRWRSRTTGRPLECFEYLCSESTGHREGCSQFNDQEVAKFKADFAANHDNQVQMARQRLEAMSMADLNELIDVVDGSGFRCRPVAEREAKITEMMGEPHPLPYVNYPRVINAVRLDLAYPNWRDSA